MAACDYSDACADRTAIRASSRALDHEPIIPVSTVVAKEGWPSIEIVYHDVDITIIVQVAKGAAAADGTGLNSGSSFCRNVFKTAVSKVLVQQTWLLVVQVQAPPGDLGVHVAI